MKLKKLIFATFTTVLLWAASAHAEETVAAAGSIAERNVKAVEKYRTALSNNTWNSKRLKADRFAVVDMNQDGVLEVFVDCRDKNNKNEHAAYISAFMYYTEDGLNINYPGEELDSIRIFCAVNPYDGRIVTEPSRGKAIYTLYKYTGWGIYEADSICLPYMTQAEIQNATQTKYSNLNYLYFVDMTEKNINTYLTGNGKETGFWGDLWEDDSYDNGGDAYASPVAHHFNGNETLIQVSDKKIAINGNYYLDNNSNLMYMNETFDVFHNTSFYYGDERISFDRFKTISSLPSSGLTYDVYILNNRLDYIEIH